MQANQARKFISKLCKAMKVTYFLYHTLSAELITDRLKENYKDKKD